MQKDSTEATDYFLYSAVICFPRAKGSNILSLV
jgi:hypothetical protein